jgi:glucose-6-phosphate 1-dehydrogenase
MAVHVKPDPRALGENPLIEGLERLPVPATTLTIFGATGDLARRKLLPALYNLAHEGALPERFNLIGVSRRDQSDDEFRTFARVASPTTPCSRVCSGG